MSTASIETQQPDNQTNNKMEERRRSVNKKNLLQERGFVDGEEIPNYIREEINRRRWTKFCSPQPCIVPDLVREFYTNFDLLNPWTVMVRGKEIAVDHAKINALYEVPIRHDEFSEVMWRLDGMSLPIIIQQICNSGTDLEDAEDNGIMKETLKPEARIWSHFAKTRILPCAQDRIVSRATAVLLHCITRHRNINVGDIIHKQMQECAKMKSRHLWFPNLITQLCRSQGVELNDDDYFIGPARTISPKVINRLTQGEIETDRDTDEGVGPQAKRRRVRQQATRPPWSPRPQQQQRQQTVEVQPGSPSTKEPEILLHHQVFPRKIKTKSGRKIM